MILFCLPCLKIPTWSQRVIIAENFNGKRKVFQTRGRHSRNWSRSRTVPGNPISTASSKGSDVCFVYRRRSQNLHGETISSLALQICLQPQVAFGYFRFAPS
jgi:hypothetical protein